MLGVVGAGCGIAAALMRRRENLDLRGKVVLITGGSRGLGLAMARDFAAEGARLALCAREPAELRAATDHLRNCTSEVLAVPCDVGDADQVENMINAVMQHYGRIDVLVNNAGVMQVGPLHTMTLADFEHAMEVIYWGVVHTTLSALPHILKSGEGRIVNITSIGGKVAVPHLLPYSASKFALVGFSEGLRAELAKDNIRVTTIVPGLMRTGSPPQADFKGRHREEYAWFAVSDALPVVSIGAERAARRVVDACRAGEAEVVLGLPAKLATWFHGLFPGVTSDLLGLVNRALPAPGGIGTQKAKGRDSESSVTESVLTAPSRAAEHEFNQPSATGLV